MVRRACTSVVAITLATAVVCAPAGAATIAASPGTDGATGDQVCSLREAITAANDDSTGGGDCTQGSGSDVITLGAGSYELGAAGRGDNNNATGDLDIKNPVTISGAGAAVTTIDANQIDRVFEVRDGATTISGVTITGGEATSPGTAGMSGDEGGGIRATSPLTLDHVTVTLNFAGNGAAGSFGTNGGSGGVGGRGGGVYAFQTLTVTDSVITNNSAGGGGNGGNATGGSGGSAGFGGYGGGIYTTGNPAGTITRTTITNNFAGSGGIGGTGPDAGNGGPGGGGGGIWDDGSVSLVIADSTITGNHGGNGGLAGGDTSGSIILNHGGSGGVGGVRVYRGTISNSVITDNIAGYGGGATTGDAGFGGSGGGVATGAEVTITGTVIANNQTGAGGNSPNYFGGGGGAGGGIVTSGSVVIRSSTISGNVTGKGGNSPGSPGSSGVGGGIAIGQFGSATVSDTTIVSNTTGAGGNATIAQGGSARGGAGIGLILQGGVELTHVTLAQNQVGMGGSGTSAGVRGPGAAIGATDDATEADTATLKNTILASNQPDSCDNRVNVVFGEPVIAYTDGGHNLVFGEPCVASPPYPGITPFSTADPLLGALADNGGPTKTMALGAGSPGIDAVPAAGSGCTAADQRGTIRPQGSACDAGAFEVFVPVPDTGGGGGGGEGGGDQPPTGGQQQPEQQPEQQPTAGPAVADKTPPGIKLQLTKQKLPKALKKGYIVVFTSDEPGTASATLGTSAKGSLKTATGKNRFVLKFTKKAKKALAKKKKVKLKLKLVVKDAAGNATTKTAKVTLKR